jgi:lysophospholipase L1-like esterase
VRRRPHYRHDHCPVAGHDRAATPIGLQDPRVPAGVAKAGCRRRNRVGQPAGVQFHGRQRGINDIRNDYSAANCFTDLQTIYNSVLADPDNRLISRTVTPFKGDTAYSAGREAERITLNDSIRGFVAANANSYLVDLAAILSDPADRQQYWPVYDLDLHPNQAGADALVAAVKDKVLAMGLA